MNEERPGNWRPQSFFSHTIASPNGFELLNERGGLAVEFQRPSRTVPHLDVRGGQSRTLSVWLTQSSTGFVTVPKIDLDLVTIRFVHRGRMIRRDRTRRHEATSDFAMLVAFDDMRDEEASGDFSAISGTVTKQSIVACHNALEGLEAREIPAFEPVIRSDTVQIRSLQLHLVRLHDYVSAAAAGGDLVFPLLEELFVFQILSVWPRAPQAQQPTVAPLSQRQVRLAVDYIEAHLEHPLRISDIASVAGVGARTLQASFRKHLNATPVAFILELRLQKVHDDLRSPAGASMTVAGVARRWGFVHPSDFTQRYRRRFGCTPLETRRAATLGSR